MYSVVVRRGNGTLLFNGTVMELQVIINTPPLCDQYEAIVTATCGGSIGGYSGVIMFAAGMLHRQPCCVHEMEFHVLMHYFV